MKFSTLIALVGATTAIQMQSSYACKIDNSKCIDEAGAACTSCSLPQEPKKDKDGKTIVSTAQDGCQSFDTNGKCLNADFHQAKDDHLDECKKDKDGECIV